jgi:hypothetical protein
MAITQDINAPQSADDSSAGTHRRLVLKSSLATLAALGTGSLSTLAQAHGNTQLLGDPAILNFALNLEYLEAEFYLRAVYGHGLNSDETSGRGQRGTVAGGSQVPWTDDHLRDIAKEIANDERDHVNFLRSALGRNKVAEPSIDLKQSFNILAQAAGLGDSFDPFESETNFLIGAFIFEDVGVTAYHGAATLISSKAYLDAAAGILAVEAYHAGVIRLLCYQMSLSQQCNAISDLREKLSKKAGAKTRTDQGILLDGGKINLVPTDANGLAFERNSDEVLNIVYAGGKKGDFGFFPEKLNGPIH